MDFQKTEEQIVNEVLTDCAQAEETLKGMLSFAQTRMTASQIPTGFEDVMGIYRKAITFYRQNTEGKVVTLHGEQDSRINEAIKEGLSNG